VIHDDDAAASKEKRHCEVLQYKYLTWTAVAEKGLGGAAAMLTPLNLLLPRH
jgi:predicted RNA methylase